MARAKKQILELRFEDVHPTPTQDYVSTRNRGMLRPATQETREWEAVLTAEVLAKKLDVLNPLPVEDGDVVVSVVLEIATSQFPTGDDGGMSNRVRERLRPAHEYGKTVVDALVSQRVIKAHQVADCRVSRSFTDEPRGTALITVTRR